jgi:SpoVK/Ycf46/Vps4 family AAA+-type ATPase
MVELHRFGPIYVEHAEGSDFFHISLRDGNRMLTREVAAGDILELAKHLFAELCSVIAAEAKRLEKDSELYEKEARHFEERLRTAEEELKKDPKCVWLKDEIERLKRKIEEERKKAEDQFNRAKRLWMYKQEIEGFVYEGIKGLRLE